MRRIAMLVVTGAALATLVGCSSGGDTAGDSVETSTTGADSGGSSRPQECLEPLALCLDPEVVPAEVGRRDVVVEGWGWVGETWRNLAVYSCPEAGGDEDTGLSIQECGGLEDLTTANQERRLVSAEPSAADGSFSVTLTVDIDSSVIDVGGLLIVVGDPMTPNAATTLLRVEAES